jgi:predicted DNA-binding transcriptional regulator AlpA
MASDPPTAPPDPQTTGRSEAPGSAAGSSGTWLTMPELAAELSQSIHTLYKWSRRGYPHFPLRTKLPNGEILVARGDLDAWMEGRRR